jgi:hypothetical protein
MDWLRRADWLTHERVRGYALLLALASLVLVGVSFWRAMPPGTTDFLAFWGAGQLTAAGNPAAAYDLAAQQRVQSTTGSSGWFAFVNPPPFLFVVAPLGVLPLPIAWAAWVALTWGLWCWAGIRAFPRLWPLVLAYPGALIVIDSGTATTLDIVGPDGGFEGGIISPGINLSMRALHDAAAQLPRIAIQKPAQVIGQDTISAMQSGVFWGYIDLIDGLVTRIKAEYGKPMKVVATGGVASLFEGASETIDYYDQDITIRGLLEIYKRNS